MLQRCPHLHVCTCTFLPLSYVACSDCGCGVVIRIDRYLNTHVNLPALQHLKRIKKCSASEQHQPAKNDSTTTNGVTVTHSSETNNNSSGADQLLILLCPPDTYDALPAAARSTLTDTYSITPYTVHVPQYAPLDESEMDQAKLLWPIATRLHAHDVVTAPVLSQQEQDHALQYLQLCAQLAALSVTHAFIPSAALIVDPDSNSIVGLAHDHAHSYTALNSDFAQLTPAVWPWSTTEPHAISEYSNGQGSDGVTIVSHKRKADCLETNSAPCSAHSCEASSAAVTAVQSSPLSLALYLCSSASYFCPSCSTHRSITATNTALTSHPLHHSLMLAVEQVAERDRKRDQQLEAEGKDDQGNKA